MELVGRVVELRHEITVANYTDENLLSVSLQVLHKLFCKEEEEVAENVVSRVLSPTRNSKASRCLKGFTSCGEDLLAEPARGHLWILVLRVDVHQFSVRYQFRGADERRRTEVAAVRHEVFLSTVRSQVSLLVLHQRYDLRGEREEGEKRPMRDHRLRISRTINLCW